MRRNQSLMVQHVKREEREQVVHMAAVTGYMNAISCPSVRQLAYALGVMHVNPTVPSRFRVNPKSVGQTNHLVESSPPISSISTQWRFAALFMKIFLLRASSSTARAIAFEGQQFVKTDLTGGQAWPTAAPRARRAKCTRAASQLLRDDLSVPCSSAMRRNEDGRRDRTKTIALAEVARFLYTVQHT